MMGSFFLRNMSQRKMRKGFKRKTLEVSCWFRKGPKITSNLQIHGMRIRLSKIFT